MQTRERINLQVAVDDKMKPALVVLFLVHSWYPWSCCGERDCHEIPCDSVTETRTGYIVDGVFFTTAQPSPDKHCHACITAARKGTCLYIQLST